MAGLNVSTRTDGGETWTPARVNEYGDGTGSYTVRARYDVPGGNPTQDQTGTWVSLRAEARDENGNRVEPTTKDAFRLTD